MWLLRNAKRFNVRPYLLLTVFLGFTKDPYPYVKKAALDGLVSLCKTGDFDSVGAIEGCYIRAVELLGDAEDTVRSAAVCAVGEWGKLLIASKEEVNKTECSNAVFIQLCSMVRDMSMEVRVEAYKALGKVGIVSENVLLQTLSKKVLGSSKQKNPHGHCSDESSDVNVAGAAGTFVHGLEDEFYEVRKSAVDALQSLCSLSIKFSTEAINLLMDMLYDDSMVVRLKVLETMYHMANCGNLSMQQMHMHSFLDTLVDSCQNIRSVARKILKLVKLPDLKLFKQFVEGLLKSLELYPQDEPDIFSTLFHIGQNNGNFATTMIKRVSKELEAASVNRSPSDSTRLTALLVLAISAPLSSKQNISCIPSRIFSYSLTVLGRFARALGDIMDQNMLFTYLSQCTLLSSASEMGFNKGELFLHAYKQSNSNKDTMKISNFVRKSSEQTSDEQFQSESQVWCKASSEVASSTETEDIDDIRKSVNLVLVKIKAIWSLLQSGCTFEALQALRACKVEVATFNLKSSESISIIEFMSQYIKVIKIVARVWKYFEPSRKLSSQKPVELELLLGKLDKRLMEIGCTFSGLSVEQELHVLELVLLSCLFRLSQLEICCYLITMKKFSSTVSHVEFLHEKGCIESSLFYKEIKKSLKEIGSSTSTNGTYCEPLESGRLISCFSLEQLTLSGNLRHINAELDIPGNSPYNPLAFVSGLPVAMPCEITLHNVSSESRLWLRITTCQGSTQFIFLDSSLLLSGEEITNKFRFLAPVYRTPRAVLFSVMVSIGMECLFEDVCCVQQRGGPKHPLAYLCGEKEVHFSLHRNS